MDDFMASITLFAGNYAPNGWALCHGQLLPISQYAAIFSLLGTTYGGDGVTTFALPDLRGRVPVGAGQGPGLSNRAQGEKGGTEAVTLTTNQLPAHNHALLASNQFGDGGVPGGAALASTDDPVSGGSVTPIYKKAVPNIALNPASVGAMGGSQPHDNMAPYLGLNYIICLQGIYPSHS